MEFRSPRRTIGVLKQRLLLIWLSKAFLQLYFQLIKIKYHVFYNYFYTILFFFITYTSLLYFKCFSLFEIKQLKDVMNIAFLLILFTDIVFFFTYSIRISNQRTSCNWWMNITNVVFLLILCDIIIFFFCFTYLSCYCIFRCFNSIRISNQRTSCSWWLNIMNIVFL